MRFISYSSDLGNGVGIRKGGEYHGLLVSELGFGLRDVIARGPAAVLDFGTKLGSAPVLAPGSFRLLPPIPQPDKIFCVGLNYRKHAEEGNSPIPEYPVIFARFHSSLVAPDAPLIRPKVSHFLDYEVESRGSYRQTWPQYFI